MRAIQQLDPLDPKAEERLLGAAEIKLTDPNLLTKLLECEYDEEMVQAAKKNRAYYEMVRRSEESIRREITDAGERLTTSQEGITADKLLEERQNMFWVDMKEVSENNDTKEFKAELTGVPRVLVVRPDELNDDYIEILDYSETLKEITKKRADNMNRVNDLREQWKKEKQMNKTFCNLLENDTRIRAIRQLNPLDPKAEKRLLDAAKIKLTDPDLLTNLLECGFCEKTVRAAEKNRTEYETVKSVEGYVGGTIADAEKKFGNSLKGMTDEEILKERENMFWLELYLSRAEDELSFMEELREDRHEELSQASDDAVRMAKDQKMAEIRQHQAGDGREKASQKS